MFPIPPNATRIRYLESTGTQYIDTGVIATGYTAAQGEFSNINYPATGVETLFGSREDAGGYKLFSANAYRDRIQFYYAGSSALTTIWTTANRAMVRLTPNDAAVNNLTNQLTSIKTDYVKPIYIFRRSCPDGVSPLQCSSGRLHSFQIYESDTLVRSYVPVRIGQTGYLFDRVSGQLFGNAGTGDFVLGPDTFSQGVLPTRMMAMGVRNVVENPYVSDGLVAWWDGEWNAGLGKHDESATVWNDLTGTYVMTQTGGSDSWGAKHLAMGNALWPITPKNDFVNLVDSPERVGGAYSIEIVLSHTNQGNKNIFGQSFPSLDCHCRGVSEQVWMKSGSDINVGPTGGGIHSISLTGERVGSTSNQFNTWCYNGGPQSSTTRAFTTHQVTDSRDIGLGRGDYMNRGIAVAKIYCIRLYSRAITAAEIAANYAIDKARFNLP